MPISNAQMIPGRFAKMARGRKIMARMNKCWDARGFVRVGTAISYTDYKPQHRDSVQMGKSGSIFVKRGKRFDCIDFCSIQFSA